ncbi:MAG: protein kinase [Planctomycetes bacterium]|nr:protein kinase [Planctomycetota bacterium]
MTPDALLRQRQLLQEQLQRREIDQATYDRMLAFFQALEGSPSAATPSNETPTMPTATPAKTAGDATPATLFPSTAPLPGGERPRPGLQVGDYRLDVPLGAGGMGEVWKAWDLVGERPVVLKFLVAEFQHNDAEMARVKQTFQRVYALQHQHICPVLHLGQDARLGYFVVMKFIAGKTLSTHRAAAGEPLTLEELVRLLRPVADALDYAHRQRIVHRDIKPSNIMVSPDGQDVQVIDFGLAAEVRTSATRISRVSMDVSGTYPYMAPEQWRGQFQDGRTDQYALAVVVYEMLAGRVPFEAPDPMVLARIVLEEPVPPIEGHPPQVNAALARALAKKREDRFATCREFVEALVRPLDPVEADIQAGIADVDGAIARLPQAPGSARLAHVCETVGVAISHGAPVYNLGIRDPGRRFACYGGCARIYLHTARQLLGWLERTAPADLPDLAVARRGLSRPVDEFGDVTEDNAEDFAWALRGAFDLTLYVDVLDQALGGLRASGRALGLSVVQQMAQAVLERGAALIQTRSLSGCAELFLHIARGLLRLVEVGKPDGAVVAALAGLAAVVRDNPQISEATVAPLVRHLLAEYQTLAQGSRQPAEGPAERPEAAGNEEELEEDLKHAQEMLKVRKRRLRVLELQEAKEGANTPAELIIELEDLRAEIAALQERITGLERRLGRRR